MRSLDDILGGVSQDISGEKVKIADWIGKPITIAGAKVLESKEEPGKQYSLIGFTYNGADYVTTTSSGIIRGQVDEFNQLSPLPYPLKDVMIQEFPSKKVGRHPWQKIVRANAPAPQPPDGDGDIPF